MARKKEQEAEEGAYWMDTYGDMVTLLLTFFVLLFAMSSVDQDKWEIFVKAFQGKVETGSQVVINVLDPDELSGDKKVPNSGQGETVGTTEQIETPENFEELFLFLQQYIKEQGMDGDVELSKGDGYTFIQFGNNIFFDGDQATIRPDAKKILDFMAGAFAYIPEQIKEVAIYGHTAQERKDIPNTLDFDWTLSNDRAKNVALYLMKKNTLTADKFSCTGYGQNRPIVPHDGTEESRKQNRRVEFRISEEGAATIPLEDIYKELMNGGNPEDIIKDKEDKTSTSSTNGTSSSDTSSKNTSSSDTSSTTSDQTSSEQADKDKSKDTVDKDVVINIPTYNVADIAKNALNVKDSTKK